MTGRDLVAAVFRQVGKLEPDRGTGLHLVRHRRGGGSGVPGLVDAGFQERR